MRAVDRLPRNLFLGVLAAAWLGIVGLLTFVFPASNRYTGRVVAISESAQVVVLWDGRPQSLRLAEVDFPERGHFRAHAVVREAMDAGTDADSVVDGIEEAPATEETAAKGAAVAALGEN
jgi:hypothetical protein